MAIWAVTIAFVAIDAKNVRDSVHTAIFNSHGAIYFVRPFVNYLLFGIVPTAMAIGLLGRWFRGYRIQNNVIWEPRRN